MAEILPSGGGEIISTEQKLPPALQELKKLIGPNNIAIIAEAYAGFSDTGKSSLLQKVQENNEGINTFVEQLQDDTSLQELLKKIILETELSQGKTELSQGKTELSQGKTDNGAQSLRTKETFDLVREASKKAYALFVNENGFKTKFQDQIGDWTTKAAIAIGVDPEKANKGQLSKEEKTKLDVSLLVSNREAIAAGLPEGKDRTEFRNLAGQLNAFATELGISNVKFLAQAIVTDPVKKQISTELLGLSPTDRVTQTGSEFRSGDQIVNISTRPPTRSIESNGIRITSTNTDQKAEYYNQTTKYQEAYAGCQTEIRNIDAAVSGEAKYLSNIATNILHTGTIDTLDESSYDQILKGLGKQLQSVSKDSNEYVDINNLGKEVAEKKRQYLKSGGLKEKQQKLPELTRNLIAIEQAKTLHTEHYKKALESETANSRENLKFLESTHLTSLLGNGGVKLLIDQINDHKDILLPGSTKLTLQSQWQEPEKQLFASGIKKLLGLQGTEKGKFFEPNGFDMKQVTDPPMGEVIKQKLTANGVYGGEPPEIKKEMMERVMSGAKNE